MDIALIAQLDAKAATGMSIGYPKFMCRLEVGLETLILWMQKVERCVSGQSLLEGSSLGKSFNFSGLDIRGLTL